MTSSAIAYPRVLLKLSGEALSGSQGFGTDEHTVTEICNEIAAVAELGTQVAIVVGGGNYFRGGSQNGMDRASADYIGMLGTVMNALTIQQGLTQIGVGARTQSAIPMSPICEPYIRGRALDHLAKGRVVIFGAGTGNPFFTTDTAASLRAIEIGAGLLLKATQVDGVYDRDPKLDPNARRYNTVSYNEVLEKRLAVMDATAIALCRENELPLRVFALNNAGCLKRIVQGYGNDGTLVTK